MSINNNNNKAPFIKNNNNSTTYCYLGVETNGQGKQCDVDKDCKTIMKKYCDKSDYKNIPYKCELKKCVFQTDGQTLFS